MIRKAPLADWLKQARENSGLSQGDVANELGYSSPQFVSNWERGLSSPPIPKYKRLCKLYNISLDEAYNKLLAATLEGVEHQLKVKFFNQSNRKKARKS